MSRRGCGLTSRLNVHRRPTDGQKLTSEVTSTRRLDRSSTITRTRRRSQQLHAGPTQPHPRPLTTSRMTARRATKEANPRPTDRRTFTEAASSATCRDRSTTIAPTQHQDNEVTQSGAAAGQRTDTAASTSNDRQPHDSTVDGQGEERRIQAHEP